MGLWNFSLRPFRSPRPRRPASSIRPILESLEDRCLPSANMMMPSPNPVMAATSTPNTMMSANAGTPLTHDQAHALQTQFQQQIAIGTFGQTVDQIVLSILQQNVARAPQFQPVIANLTRDIAADQTVLQTLQGNLDLLNRLDDAFDQQLALITRIQFDTAVIPVLQQLGNVQVANSLQNATAANQTALQALTPQIAVLEQEVSAAGI